MNYLKISNGKGSFRNKDGEYKEIDTITKEDILYLLDEATDSTSNFEMDEITDDSIKNEAHKIIYKSIYSKFSNLLNNKKQFLDECDGLYKDALQKYKPKEEVMTSNGSSSDNIAQVDVSSFKSKRITPSTYPTEV
ncbi:hypothetical protein [Ruminococcus albus]|uniref:Uncharacterized protein n=1 Tax=Ruminococcus albus (strain ATCC 27210 / DSM 20455 / JCM 14654 / NCDO 2250 / 7) TaxID=697329 RepID=E6UDB6_RUMA7|nr:hypothetical protein [Ruminococcus albus]ADU22799.1 hypothetical protein Rumal_2316 [Ruminococcus albus 7 = DSM 20455]